MAASPAFKIYNGTGEYEACCKHAETAAAIVSFLGEQSQVRLEHRYVIWTEGQQYDGQAFLSYDHAASKMLDRISQINAKSFMQVHPTVR